MQTPTMQTQTINNSVSLFISNLVAALGSFLQKHRLVIFSIQFSIVIFYFGLLIVPIFYPIPNNQAHIFDNVTLFAQFIFWGIWWPFVILSMLFLGRLWCGVFCPEGALSEWTSRYFGKNKHIPRWIKWRGWPAFNFACITLYGQLISVYDYAKPALLILGGSTLVAILMGYLYGKGTRVWCKYVCPVSGVFNLLSRLAPFSFKTNETVWKACANKPSYNPNCPPMINIRQLHGVSSCHMCGKCNDYRGAIKLTPRSANEEIVKYGHEKTNMWDQVLLLYGMIGVGIGAFTWTVSPWFVWFKHKLATLLVTHDIFWPLYPVGHWWLLTDYPQVNDAFNWLDGFCIASYILGSGLLFGTFLSLALIVVSYLDRTQVTLKHHLAQAYIPIAFAGLFLGLTATTVKLLQYEGIVFSFVPNIRAFILVVTSIWSCYLCFSVLNQYILSVSDKLLAGLIFIATLIPIITAWYLMFWGW